MSTYSLRGGLPSSTSLASLASSFAGGIGGGGGGGAASAAAMSNVPIPASVAPAIAWMDAHLAELGQRMERLRQKSTTLSSGGCDAQVLAPVQAEMASLDNEMRSMEHERRQTVRRALAAERRAKEQAEKEAAQTHRYNLLAEARSMVAAEREATAAAAAGVAAGASAAVAQAAAPPGYRHRASVSLHVESVRPRHHNHHQPSHSHSHSPYTPNAAASSVSGSPSPAQSPRSPGHSHSDLTLPPLDNPMGGGGGGGSGDDELQRRAAAASRRNEFEKQFGGLGPVEPPRISPRGHSNSNSNRWQASSSPQAQRHGRHAAPLRPRDDERWIMEEGESRQEDTEEGESTSGSESDERRPQWRRGSSSHPRTHALSPSLAVGQTPGWGSSRHADPGLSRAVSGTAAAAPAALFLEEDEEEGAYGAHGHLSPSGRDSFLESAAAASARDLTSALQNFLEHSGAGPEVTATDALGDPLLREKVAAALEGYIAASTAAAAAAATAAGAEPAPSSDDASADGAPQTQQQQHSTARSALLQVSPQEKLLWGLLVGTVTTEEESSLALAWWQQRQKQLYAASAAEARKQRQRGFDPSTIDQRHAQAHQAALERHARPADAAAASAVPTAPPALPPAPGSASHFQQQQAQQRATLAANASTATTVVGGAPVAPVPPPVPASASASVASPSPSPSPSSSSSAHAARGAILNRMHLLQEEIRQIKAAKLLNELELQRRFDMQARAQAQAQAHAARGRQGALVEGDQFGGGQSQGRTARKQEPMARDGVSLASSPRNSNEGSSSSSTSQSGALAAATALQSSSTSSSSPIEPMCRRFVYSLLASTLANHSTLQRQDKVLSDLRWALAKARRVHLLTMNGSINRPASARPRWVSAVSVPSPMPPLQMHHHQVASIIDLLVVAPDQPPAIKITPFSRTARAKAQQQRLTTGSGSGGAGEQEEEKQQPDASTEEVDDDLVAPVHRPGRGWSESRYVAPVFDATAAAGGQTGELQPPVVPPRKTLKIALPAREMEAHAIAITTARSRPASAAAPPASAASPSRGYVPPHPDRFVFADGMGGAEGPDGGGGSSGGPGGGSSDPHTQAHHLYALQRSRQTMVAEMLRRAAEDAGADTAPPLEDLSLLGSPPPLLLSPDVLQGLPATSALYQNRGGGGGGGASPTPVGVAALPHKDEWGEFVRGLDEAQAHALALAHPASYQTAARSRSPSRPGASGGGGGASGAKAAAAAAAAAQAASKDPTGKSRPPPLTPSERYALQCSTGPKRLMSVEDIPAALLPRREYAGLTLAQPHPDRQPDANEHIRAREKTLLLRARKLGPATEESLRRTRKDFVALFAAGSNSFEWLPLNPDKPARRCFAECETRYEVDHHLATPSNPLGSPHTPRNQHTPKNQHHRPASAAATTASARSSSRPGSRPLSPRRAAASPRTPHRPATARPSSSSRPPTASITNATRSSLQLAQMHRANGSAPGHSIVRTVMRAASPIVATRIAGSPDRGTNAGVGARAASASPSRVRLLASRPSSARRVELQSHPPESQQQHESQSQRPWSPGSSPSRRTSMAEGVGLSAAPSRYSTPTSWSSDAAHLHQQLHQQRPMSAGTGTAQSAWSGTAHGEGEGDVDGDADGDGSDTERDFQLAPSPSAILHARQMLALAARPAPACVQRNLQPPPPPQRSANRFRHYRQGSEW